MTERKFEELNLNDAFLFAAALQQPEICRLILELILDRPMPEVKVHAEMAILLNSDFRSVRLDVYAEDQLQVGYDLEMQNDGKNLLPKRARFYQSNMDAGALKPGDDFDELKPSYVIFICTYDPFDRQLYRYTFEERCLEQDFPLGDGTRKIFLNTKGTNRDEVPEGLVQFLHYVEESSDDYISGIEDRRVRQLHDRIQALKKSRKWRGQYMTIGERLDKAEAKAHAEGEAAGHAKGLQEGEAAGHAKGLEEGTKRVFALMEKMRESGEGDQISRLGEDEAFLRQMFEKYQV